MVGYCRPVAFKEHVAVFPARSVAVARPRYRENEMLAI